MKNRRVCILRIVKCMHVASRFFDLRACSGLQKMDNG